MHRVLLREIVIDVPGETFDATRAFWAGALDADTEDVTGHPQFTAMRHPAALAWVGLQRLQHGPARFHLDIETDDVDAEVERLLLLGAERIAVGRDWVTLADPSGLVFDVVPFESPDFDTRSREVSSATPAGAGHQDG